MTLSTFAAGFLITVVTIAIELLDKDMEKERKRIESKYND